MEKMAWFSAVKQKEEFKIDQARLAKFLESAEAHYQYFLEEIMKEELRGEEEEEM